MKKKLLIAVSYVLILALGIMGTVAYFTDREAEVNVFTVGDVQIDLKMDENDDLELMPGKTIELNSNIENIGKNEAWVWLKLTVEDGAFDLNALNVVYDASKVIVKDNGMTLLCKDKLAAGADIDLIKSIAMKENVDATPDGELYLINNGVPTKLNWNINKGYPTVKVAAYAIQTYDFATVEEAYAAYYAQWGTNDNAKPEPKADVWDGKVDTAWYNDTDTEFTLTTAEQVAGLADLVDGGNTFAGKTIKLDQDLDLYAEDENGERISFDPIGYGYDVVFKGTFDGQGNTISNLYQNGWALGLDYSTEGGGLFASVVDAEIKNVTIDNAEIVMECIDMGALVGYSYGNCTYENITVSNSTIANYNRYTGGVVGEVNGTQTFKNVDVDAGTTVSALWGTYDASLGGIIGGKWGTADITFEDCDVACELDAFNDACSNYQYYNYRLCGMLIGMSEEVTDGTASASYLKATNCTVTYGDWANYTYCESESYGKGSYAAADEWKYKRVQEGYATDGVDPNHTHDTDESHEELMVFDQLFGGDKGVRGGKTHDGVTVVYNNK